MIGSNKFSFDQQISLFQENDVALHSSNDTSPILIRLLHSSNDTSLGFAQKSWSSSLQNVDQSSCTNQHRPRLPETLGCPVLMNMTERNLTETQSYERNIETLATGKHRNACYWETSKHLLLRRRPLLLLRPPQNFYPSLLDTTILLLLDTIDTHRRT